VSVNAALNDPDFRVLRVDLQLDAAAAHGVRLGRSDAFWGATELVAHGRRYFSWGVNDRVAEALARRGIRWWPILDYSTLWATTVPGTDHAPPVRAEDYANYARAFAERYGPEGRFWRLHPELPKLPVAAYEIWNEPDAVEFWRPAPDPVRYLDLYLRARDAIRRVDATTPVIVGGLTNQPAFLVAMLASRAGSVGHVDGVGIHPYGRTPVAVIGHVRDMRRALDALGGHAVPLLVTEFGWEDRPPNARFYASPGQKAEFLTRTMRALVSSDCGIAAVIPYSWTTAQRDPRYDDDWFGFYGRDGQETPSSRALGALLRSAGSARVFPHGPPAPLCRGFVPAPEP
jgi:hypothetical protein